MPQVYPAMILEKKEPNNIIAKPRTMEQPLLGNKISELRKQKGMTQAELAEISKVNLRTVQRIELGQVMPRSHTVKLIFKSLGVEYFEAYTKLDAIHNKKAPKKTKKKLFRISIASVLFLVFMGIGWYLFGNSAVSDGVPGWTKVGAAPESYRIGLDNRVFMEGGQSAYIEWIGKSAQSFGTMSQSSSAHSYIGKAVKMKAYIKTKDVSGWTGLWIRVDSRNDGKMLGLKNMYYNQIKGTNDWSEYEVVLNVPEGSGALWYGILLQGKGKVWIDQLSFETMEQIVEEPAKQPEAPRNVDFESPS